MPQRGEYRATTDQMLELIDALRAAEERKRNVPIGSPAFVEAAVEAEHLSRLAFRWAQLELQMATSAKERVAAGQLPADVSLVDVEPRKLDVSLLTGARRNSGWRSRLRALPKPSVPSLISSVCGRNTRPHASLAPMANHRDR